MSSRAEDSASKYRWISCRERRSTLISGARACDCGQGALAAVSAGAVRYVRSVQYAERGS